MPFHWAFHLAKNAFLGEILAEISSCVTSPARRRGKELVSLLHCTFKKKIRPMPLLLFSSLTTFYLGFVCLSQSIYILSFIITLSIPHRYVWMNRTELQDGTPPLSFANHPLYLHLSCFHSHTHYHCLCLLSHSLFTVSFCFFFFVSFAKYAAGISFLSYWSQSAKKREDIRMERVRGGIIPSFNWFQTFSPLGDLLPEL